MLIVLQWLFSFYRARATVRSSIALLSWLCFLVKLLCIGPVLRWLCSYHVGRSQHVVAAQIHPQLSIWSVMALRLDICSHVSLVWPTWRQDNGCGPLPPIVWQYRQFVCLLSAGKPSQFPAPTHKQQPSIPRHLCTVTHSFQTASQNIPIFSFIPGAPSLDLHFLTASVDLATYTSVFIRNMLATRISVCVTAAACK